MKLEDIPSDYESFLAALNKHQVDYLIIGGHASMFHGRFARFSKDLDLWIRQTMENAKKVSKAVLEYANTSLPPETLMLSKQKVELGSEDFKIEAMTYIEGVDFEEAWSNRVAGNFGAIQVHFVSKDLLVKMKKLSGRPKDILDLEQINSQPDSESK